jgi:hypothetical protein
VLPLGQMDLAGLISQLQDCIQQIATLREERQAIGSPKVKAWKTEVEQLLRLGGKNTSKLLQNFQNLKFGAGAMGSEHVSSGVKFQAYQAELDSTEKLLKNAIQTIQIFGISEEQKYPEWFKPKVEATGLIKLGSREVDIKTITIDEFLSAILTLSESDKSVDDSLKKVISDHVETVRKHSLLQPFLSQTLDKLFSKL